MAVEINVETWEGLAREGQLGKAVVAYVKKYDWVTFVELQRRFETFMPVNGTWALTATDNTNLIFWAGMSQEFMDLVEPLLREERIYYHPAQVLTYWIDGGTLNIPVAKSARKYKTKRWVPVFLRTVPIK